jgi:eukaryotic-like serine/threonine-protein kinase
MLSESEKRAAALAVSRYGADRDQVQRTVQTVLEARARGQGLDLLDSFREQKLLTDSQTEEIRSLELTLIDPNGEARNGAAKGAVKGSAVNKRPPSSADEAAEDLRALGDYRILRRLGIGGMGAVYLAYEEAQERYVALKVLPTSLAANQTLVDRFYREAKSGALLSHPNIVRNITVGQDKATGKHYLVLEYVDGPSAQALLDQHGPLRVGDAVHIVLDVARALEHAHSRNVVHRDIKPANILITQSGVAKLADLGLAKRTDEASHLTHARQGFGTPYYMPYEQAMNARSADARSDIYALGGTLYHLVTGEVPFPGTSHLEIVDKKNLGFYEPARSRNLDVPLVLDQILAKMLAREPRDRYQTSSELIVDLERAELAATVPSFIDPDRALADPLVRQRLTAPAQATVPDMNVSQIDARGEPARAGLGREEPGTAAPEIWYLRYKDRHDRWCKAKATVAQIVQRVRDGKLGADTEASHQPQGEFRPLAEFAEFREALDGAVATAASAAPSAAPKKRRRAPIPPPVQVGDSAVLVPPRNWLLLGLAASMGVLVLIVCVYLIFGP